LTKYRADIDGLRAIAVLVVVFYHAGFTTFSGGYVGVDVFFVISGFVITRRLLDDVYANRFSISDFYVRRMRRIFPALFLVVAITWLVGLFLFLPPHFEDLSKSTVATALFSSNIYFWRSSGYFDISALVRPLLHTWSLAVEEQYYVFMPLAIFVVARFWQRKWLWFFIPVTLASFGLSVAATAVAPTANFFLLPTRAWELLLGALLVMAPLGWRIPRLAANALGVAGLCLIAYAVLTFTEETPFPGFAALLPCVGAALLIYAGGVQPGILAARFLSLAPLVSIGLISYSMYLYHWPLIVFSRYVLLREFTIAESGGLIVASVALGYLSYRFVEQPFRYPRQRRRAGPVFAATLGAVVLVGALGVVGAVSRGFPSRFPDFVKREIAGYHEWKPKTCFLLSGQSSKEWRSESCMRTTGHSRNILLWGDSFAAHYVPGLIRHGEALPGNVIQYTAAGCMPILSFFSYSLPLCQEFNLNVLDVIKQQKIETVIMSGRWSSLRGRGVDGLRPTIETLKKLGVDVYVIGQSPIFPIDVHTLAYRDGNGKEQADLQRSLAIDPHINEQLRDVIADSAVFIDPLPRLCVGTLCPYMQGGRFLYEDYGHFSTDGADRAVGRYISFGAFARAKTPDLRASGH